MMSEPERKLAAIMYADVVGYSRLMGADESGTHRRLRALREAVFKPQLAAYQGRTIRLMGDGTLVEFASIVDALACAVEIQRAVTTHNIEVAEDERIVFRFGINLGDIIVDDEDIHGDGVNIAARLEGLADSGGICISGTVFDAIGNKLPLRYEFMGEQQVKNIAQPVRAYQVQIPADATMPAPSLKSVKKLPPSQYPWQRWAIAVAVAAMLVGGVLWSYFPPVPTPFPSTANSDTLDKHRIAVLPFTNISADPKQEYFTDGMTEELISKLSRISELAVIARTSVMKYKGTDKDIAEIGQTLKVGTILEGSVRKSDNQLRITVQLIDVTSQEHLWSQDYDRELKAVFAIQSDVAQQVADALQVTLLDAEKQQIAKHGTDNLEAYAAYLQGVYHYGKLSQEGFETAKMYFDQAIEKDPRFARAYAGLALVHQSFGEWGLVPPEEALPKASALATQAIEIDPETAEAYAVLASIRTYEFDWAGAEQAYRKALKLDPSSAFVYDYYGIIYLSPAERHDEAIAANKKAVELDPLSLAAHIDLGWVFNHARRYDEAIAPCEKALELNRELPMAFWCLGFARWQMEQFDEAKSLYEKALELDSGISTLKSQTALLYSDAGDEAMAKQYLNEFNTQIQQGGYVSPLALAQIYIALKDKDKAFEWLEKAYLEHTLWLIYVKMHPIYDFLRPDPRFDAFLKKVGFQL